MMKMVTTSSAMSQLDITKETLFSWIANGTLRADKVTAGKRYFYLFKQIDIDRLKPTLPTERGPGKRILGGVPAPATDKPITPQGKANS
jgi:hypothetical protein